MTADPMLQRLKDDASQGADLSPGNPVAAWAVGEIERMTTDFGKVVIANAEVAALNGMLQEQIARLSAALDKIEKHSEPPTNKASDIHKWIVQYRYLQLIAREALKVAS